jgi:prepilin-type N-terminal cleavage/methylation domain-containing protein
LAGLTLFEPHIEDAGKLFCPRERFARADINLMRGRHRGVRGITLIELLVSIVVLGIIAAPILGCIVFVRQSMADARTEAKVQSALRDAVYSTAASGKTIALTVTNLVGTTQRLLGGTDLVVTTTVTRVSGYNNLFSIKATATWTQSNTNGRAQASSLETYVISPQT